MEAVIILAALLAGLRGAENLPVRRRVMGGAGLAVAMTCITFVLSRTLIRSLTQYGERLEAVVSVLAVAVLFVVTNWVFHKFYWVGWNAKLRQLTRAAVDARRRRWEALALLGVGFLTVYREGFETTLFLQSLWLEGGSTAFWIGIGAGVLFITVVGALIFRFGVKLPYRRMLVTTDVLGIGVARSWLSSDFGRFQRALGAPAARAETVLEATYRIVLAPWWTVQPDVQYIFNPGGNDKAQDALVLGCRTSIQF